MHWGLHHLTRNLDLQCEFASDWGAQAPCVFFPTLAEKLMENVWARPLWICSPRAAANTAGEGA
jgi:hypothetical protein